jgi:hypothetical protein
VNTFGPPVATHRASKIVLGGALLLASGSGFLAWLSLHTTGKDSPGDYRIYVGIALFFLAGAFSTWKKLVVLYADGITYRNVFGEQQMRWDELEKFYYSATKRSVNFIPIGTYYTFKLIDGRGKKISFGTGVEKPQVLGIKLIELTQLPLLKKAAHQFDSGIDVDFGPIKLNRTDGISAKKFFGGWKQMPLNNVYSYSIDKGMFFIWDTRKKLFTGAAISSIPNAFVLNALLDVIFKPKAQSTNA